MSLRTLKRREKTGRDTVFWSKKEHLATASNPLETNAAPEVTQGYLGAYVHSIENHRIPVAATPIWHRSLPPPSAVPE
jgi:hypothetical protein